MASKLCQRDE
uniref:Uncharacterized protein n=1 Tax=Anguilla anguilla TaxID=7936 RepID=A0A0E9PZV0_ANGAN